MSVRRSDSVFLLTLVDFLVQIIFFGLLIFVFYKSAEGRSKRSFTPEQVGKAIDAAGVSNIVELTDELTKLAPVGLKGMNTKLGAGNKDADIAKAADLIEHAGGAAGLVKKLEQGMGKPPCLSTVVNGVRQVQVLASVVGTASTITFQSETPELKALLRDLGSSYDQVRSLPVSRFAGAFNRVLTMKPHCRYTVEIRETTGLVYARDAVGQVFYTKLKR